MYEFISNILFPSTTEAMIKTTQSIKTKGNIRTRTATHPTKTRAQLIKNASTASIITRATKALFAKSRGNRFPAMVIGLKNRFGKVPPPFPQGNISSDKSSCNFKGCDEGWQE